MSHSTQTQASTPRRNKKRRICPKPPLKLKEIWAIRIRLQLGKCTRDLALFNLAIDSKLRGCDLVRLRVDDIALGGRAVARATVVQRKTRRPVRFELTEQTRKAPGSEALMNRSMDCCDNTSQRAWPCRTSIRTTLMQSQDDLTSGHDKR